MTERSVSVKLSASAQSYISAMRQATEATKDVAKAAISVRSELSSVSSEAARASSAIQRSMRGATGDIRALSEALNRVRLPAGGLQGADVMTRQIHDLQDQLARLRADANRPMPLPSPSRASGEARGGGGSSAGSLISAGAIARLAGYTAGVVGLGAAVKSTYSQTATFETNVASFGAVTKTSGANLKAVGDLAIKLGGDVTIAGANASDAAETMTELAKGGLSVKDSMIAAKGTLQLASAAVVGFGTAAGIQTAALNSFQLGADQAGKVADILANTASAASGEITDFAEGMKQAGTVAHGVGFSLTDVSTVLAQFANAGIKGSMGGNIFKSMLLSMEKATGPSGKALEKLGVSLRDSNGTYITAAKLEDELASAKKRMGAAAFNQTAALAFGTRGVIGAGIAANNGAKGFNAMKKSIDDGAGAAAFSQAKMSGLGGAFKNFQNQVETAQVTLGEKFSPAIQKVVGGLSAAIPKITGFLTGGAIGGGLAKLGTWFQPLIDGAHSLLLTAWPYVEHFGAQLGVVWHNILAGIKPVSDAIGGFFSAVSKNGTAAAFGKDLTDVGNAAVWVSKAFKPIGDVIGGVLKWLSGLHPAALEAGVGLLLLLKYGSSIPAAFANIKASAAALAQNLGKAGLFAGALWVFNQISDQFSKIKQNQQDVIGSTNDLTSALVANNGQWSEQIRNQQIASISGTSQFQKLISSGAGYADTMDFLTGKTHNFAKILAEVAKSNGGKLPLDVIDLAQWAAGMNKAGDTATSSAKQQLSYVAATKKSADAQRAAAASAWNLVPAYLKNGQDIDKAGRVTVAAMGGIATATGKVGSAAKTAQIDTDLFYQTVNDAKGKPEVVTKLSTAFDHYNTAVSAADTTTQLFIFTMDKLAGRNVSVEDAMTANASAARALGKSHRDEAAAAQAVTDAQGKLADAQNHLNDKNKTTRTSSSDVAAAQRALADAIDGTRDATDAAKAADTQYQKTAALRITQVAMHAVKQGGFTLAVKQSTAEMQRQRDAFIAQQPAADIASGAAGRLADKYGLIPKNVTTILKGDPKLAVAAANEAQRKADAYAKAKHEAKIIADNRDAIAKIHGVQIALDGVKDKKVKLTVDASGGVARVSSDGSFTTSNGSKGFAAGGHVRGPGTGTSDSIPAMLSAGEFVVNASATKAHGPLLESINKYANGGLVGGLDISSAGTGNIDKTLTSLRAVYARADASAAKADAAARVAAAIPHANSGGTEQWRALAMSVAAAKGENPASVQVMLNQMSRESSGNPAAINLTDSNAQAGHPSVGLLQFIPSTFAAYADPGFNSNIYDPASQMHAWYNYINARYGGYQSFGQRGYGAYASGGRVSGPGSGTSDSIPARVSNGEFIVNARSASRNMGLLTAINSKGYAAGGVVSASGLAGIASPTPGDRQGNVIAALTNLAQVIADARTKAADAAAAQHEALKQSLVDQSNARVADKKYQNELAARAKAKTAAQKKSADAGVAAALVSKRAADASVVASTKTLSNAKVTATAAANNVAATSKAQQRLQATYHSLQQNSARYDTVTGKLGTARDNLASTQQNKAAAVSGYASQVAGYDGGLTGHSDVRGTSASVIGGLKFDLGKIQSFNRDLSKLAKEGLSANLLAQLTNAFGSGGEVTAHALATGPLANIKAANSIQAAITATSNAIGATTASPQFDPLIRSQQNLVNNLASQQRALNASLVKYASTIDARITAAMRGWSVQLNAQGLAKLVDQGHRQAGRR